VDTPQCNHRESTKKRIWGRSNKERRTDKRKKKKKNKDKNAVLGKNCKKNRRLRGRQNETRHGKSELRVGGAKKYRKEGKDWGSLNI